ncbi:hypothetical protein IRJ41_001064, partial [Triplophysa rosa]
VFGDEVKSVSVMEGDSVTLHTGLTELQTDHQILWMFNGERKIIAKIDRDTNKMSIDLPGNNDERFRDRLKLNDTTGDLTITHIKTSDSGDYKMEIIGSRQTKHKTFIVSVIDEVKSVVVMEGHPVTLHIDIQTHDVKWTVNGTDLTDSRVTNSEVNHQTGDLIISNIRRDQTGVYRVEITNRGSITHKSFYITVMDEMKSVVVMEGDPVTLHIDIQSDDVKWTFNGADLTDSRVTNSEVNHQTGDLIISNIRRDQTGEYRVEINNRGSITHKLFYINVMDEMKSVVVMEGDPVTLHIDIQSDDVKWTFNGADLTDSRVTNSEVNHQTGDLIISNIRRDQTGEYRVEINNRGSITHKLFYINVMESSQRSHWEITGPVCLGGLILLIVLIVSGVLYKYYRRGLNKNKDKSEASEQLKPSSNTNGTDT